MLRRSLHGAVAAGRQASQLHCTPQLTPPRVGSSSGALAPNRFFSQVSTAEPFEAIKRHPKAKLYPSTRKSKRDKNLTKLTANPENVDVALGIFADTRSVNGSGLSKDVATNLVTIFVDNKKVDEALQVLELCTKKNIFENDGRPFELVMTATYAKKQFDAALKVIDLALTVNVTPSNLMYTTALLSAHRSGKDDLVPKILEQMLENAEPNASQAFQIALSAAAKSQQQELVALLVECSKTLGVALTSEYYHSVLKGYAAAGDFQAVLGVRDALKKDEIDLTEDGMYWLVHSACKADQWDLVKELLAEEGGVATVNSYNAAIAAYGNHNRWSEVVDLYGIMPENLRSELKGWHLGAVIMGHASMEREELKLRALEIFGAHKDRANGFAYTGAITAQVETEQFAAALALSEEMKVKEIQWGKTVYQAVALALIRQGTTEEALQLLENRVRKMGANLEGYEDIIQFYTSTKEA
ncbi:Pentatricopeptide repeat-containing protein [Phytophthora citrophthora]|uniref:Pentatricopeptide repeat-containing protein n=1 Tax=Phytophthora citrophthora TaxID=4793 RepID=A0AAD9LMR6_9STRA|nr:Pentatricopeptide repeat-containing protein [Phytophthora citrophthora]